MLWQKRKPIKLPRPYCFPGLELWQEGNLYLFETSSPSLTRIYKKLARILNSHAPILLCGESGCGKIVIAQALHHAGPAGPRALLLVNCDGTTETQFTQAFAHALNEAKNAAHTNGKNSVRQHAPASVTVILRNVLALAPELQHCVLRLLQEKATHISAPEAAQVRLIATTTKTPAPAVKQGHFRQDLYYRLSTYEFELPPLRERMEDLSAFIAHFSAKAARQNGGHQLAFSANASATLQAHTWPGNLAESEDTLLRAHKANSGRNATIEHLDLAPAELRHHAATRPANLDQALFTPERVLEISSA